MSLRKILAFACLLYFLAVPQAYAATKPLITGSIVQLWAIAGWDQSTMERELGYMKTLGMNHVVAQWTLENTPEQKTVYYASEKFAACNGYSLPYGVDTLLNLLKAATSTGIDVYVGLSWNNEWWNNSNKSEWLDEETGRILSQIDEIAHSKADYLGYSAFKGWYIPWEIDNVSFKTFEQQVQLRKRLRTITTRIKARSTKQVMISPFFNEYIGGQTPTQWQTMWTFFLGSFSSRVGKPPEASDPEFKFAAHEVTNRP